MTMTVPIARIVVVSIVSIHVTIHHTLLHNLEIQRRPPNLHPLRSTQIQTHPPSLLTLRLFHQRPEFRLTIKHIERIIDIFYDSVVTGN